MLLNAENSALLVIDIQEKLTPQVTEPEQLVRHARWILEVADELSIPVLISEQYPKGLGMTLPELKAVAKTERVFSKVHFSAARDLACMTGIQALSRQQLVLIGIEAHVCVLQTALDLKQKGFDVFVATDTIASRDPQDKKIALKRLWYQGLQLVTREMLFFEWLSQAGTEQFKQMSKRFLLK